MYVTTEYTLPAHRLSHLRVFVSSRLGGDMNRVELAREGARLVIRAHPAAGKHGRDEALEKEVYKHVRVFFRLH